MGTARVWLKNESKSPGKLDATWRQSFTGKLILPAVTVEWIISQLGFCLFFYGFFGFGGSHAELCNTGACEYLSKQQIIWKMHGRLNNRGLFFLFQHICSLNLDILEGFHLKIAIYTYKTIDMAVGNISHFIFNKAGFSLLFLWFPCRRTNVELVSWTRFILQGPCRRLRGSPKPPPLPAPSCL